MRYRYSFNIQRKQAQLIFILYDCVLFYVVFLTSNRYRGDTSAHINLIPIVETIRLFYEQGNQHFWDYYIGYWGNIFGNILLFLPFGFLLKKLYPQKSLRRICLYGSLLSIIIECLQLILRIGVCDVDDVILNVTGVATGVLLYQVIKMKTTKGFTDSE